MISAVPRSAHALDLPIPKPRANYRIGVVGAGAIVTGCHLPAYTARGWTVSCIASRSLDAAEAAAKAFSIPRASNDWRKVIHSDDVDVVDVSLPPHLHAEVCREAFDAGKHVLVQKPMTPDLLSARDLVERSEKAKVRFAVNQNGRYDPAIRACKQLIDDGIFGTLVTATMELRTRQAWQSFWESDQYRRLMMLGMSIHHLDQFRFLFGEPLEVTAVTAKYPGQPWPGESIAIYTLRYADGLLAHGYDDGFPWTRDWRVSWRVEGIDSIAMGDIGWPTGGFSTLRYTTRDAPDSWTEPALTRKWFPDAFAGTMGALFDSIAAASEPQNSARDNLRTLRLVEACYLSAAKRRTVEIGEIPL